jgi:Tol biopolymer transport system component
MEDVDAGFSFINGGQRVCFYRRQTVAGTYKFLSASEDGADEQVLVNRKSPYPNIVACAPNGRLAILFEEPGQLETLDFNTGSKQTLLSLTGQAAYLSELCWDPSGKGLFAILRQIGTPRTQLSFLSYPGAEMRQITNDPSDYRGISLTADGRTIVTRQTEWHDRFKVLSLAEPSRLEEHGPRGVWTFTWLDNGKILANDEQSALRLVNLFKNETTTLNVAKGHFFYAPSLCGPDKLISIGGTLVGNTVSVYKMNLDGSGATQLTQGPLNKSPECTSDGRWLFYVDFFANRDPHRPFLMRLSLHGGTAQRVASDTWLFDLSPDGKLLAMYSRDGSPHLQILSTDSLQIVQSFPLPLDFQNVDVIAFLADNKGVFYPTQTGADTTIWRQPLEASAPVKVASIPSGEGVYWIRPSPDGTKLGWVLYTQQSRAVLLRDAR